MNWEFIGKYLPMYEKAALLTVKIGVIGILFAILLGLVCAARKEVHADGTGR